LNARRLHAIFVVETKLGARHEDVLWQLLHDQKIEWTVCFNVSHFVLVNVADAVGGTQGD
jgi:hypothetical protein